MWVSLMIMVGYGFWRSFEPSLLRGWRLLRQSITTLVFSLFQVKIPETVETQHVVHATSVIDAMQQMGYTGEWSFTQAVRPLKRKTVSFGKWIYENTFLRAAAVFDSAVKRATGTADSLQV